MPKKNDLPAHPIYWGDIFKAPDVCSLPKDIRDTFFLCLGRMWESNPRGYLIINNRKPTDLEYASMLLMGSDTVLVNHHLNHLVYLAGIFSIDDQGIIYSRRMIKDEENRRIKKENGKKGGNPHLLGYPEVNQEVILNHENETENETENKVVKKLDKCAENFERFWSAYPKKKSKGDALKAWKQIKPGAALLNQIIEKIEALSMSDDWLKDGGKFIPYPATWLRAQGWDDEVKSSVPQMSELTIRNMRAAEETIAAIERGEL